MSGTNGEAMGMGGEAHKPKPSPDMDLGLMNSLADAADHYAFGQLFEWQEAEFDIVRAKIFLGEDSEEGREVIDSRRRQIAQILGRQAAAKAYAEGLRERIRNETFSSGGLYYGRHYRPEGEYVPSEPEQPVETGVRPPSSPKETEKKPDSQPWLPPESKPNPEPKPQPQPKTDSQKDVPQKPATPEPSARPDQEKQPDTPPGRSSSRTARGRRRVIRATNRLKPTIITQRKSDSQPEPIAKTEPSTPAPVVAKKPPSQPAPESKKTDSQKRGEKVAAREATSRLVFGYGRNPWVFYRPREGSPSPFGCRWGGGSRRSRPCWRTGMDKWLSSGLVWSRTAGMSAPGSPATRNIQPASWDWAARDIHSASRYL